MRILPTPKSLGFSHNHFLNSTLFMDDDDKSTDTWEEYYKKCKEQHPVRYFIYQTVKWLSKWPRVEDAFYWLRTHTKDRYHILSLKEAEPENKDGYKWGWIDRSEALALANFLVLRKFVEEERSLDCSEAVKKAEEEGDPHGQLPLLRSQQEGYEEIMALYNWWVKDRFEEYRIFDEQEKAARDTYHKNGTQENSDKYYEACEAKNKREEEMLIRLVKIRKTLWT